jgi:Uma2 family endonuclease
VKAVLLEVRPDELARRKAIGADRWDEMWEGVLHMTLAPGLEHQRTLDELVAFLLPLFRRTARGTLHSGINVFEESSPRENYRIPDATFVAVGREAILAEDGVRGGGPDAVIEIRSPGDESYDKLPFYAALLVREVVIVDRDSKRPEIYRLAGGSYVAVSADRDGWVAAETMRLRLCRAPGSAALVVEDLDDPGNQTEL